MNHSFSRNTTNLIYCQLVTGLGYYYSPLLPLVTSITLIITFYLQFYLCRFNFKLSKENFSSWIAALKFNNAIFNMNSFSEVFQQKTWVSSQVRTVYMIISFLAMTVAVVFFLVAITNTEVKTLCGPFPVDEAPIYSSGIYNNDNSVSYWVLNPPIWVGIAGKRKVKI